MNPRATVAHESAVNPFEMIVEHEEKEDRRVEEALQALAAEERVARTSYEELQRIEEEKAREQAKEELRTYRDQELGSLLQQAQEMTMKEADALRIAAKKHAPALIRKLTDAVTSLKLSS